MGVLLFAISGAFTALGARYSVVVAVTFAGLALAFGFWLTLVKKAGEK
jgi:hypothetical protein